MLAAASVALTALAPVVVHDSREASPLTSVAAASVRVPAAGADRRPAVYARAVPSERGGTWLQYWLFYAQQDQDRGIVRTGRHAGDWELVQYRVDVRGRPAEAVYAQHSGAERCGWQAVARRDGRPAVFAARGSHASYLRPGVRDRTWPDPNDEADGRGRAVVPRVVPVSAASPDWMRWPGRWGAARAAWWNPLEESSPRGPAFQPERWRDPDAWARSARSCRAGCDTVGECDGREQGLGLGAAAIAILALSGAWRRRRSRGLRGWTGSGRAPTP